MKQVLIWCELNSEHDRLEKLLGKDAFSIRGSTPNDLKIAYEQRWREGERPVLITKPKCSSFGMNWQNCSDMIFVGLSDSYEQYYQAVRRCYRFGQKKPVNVHIIISAKEGCVKENIERKQKDAEKMQAAMIELTKEITKKELQSTKRISTPYDPSQKIILPRWVS